MSPVISIIIPTFNEEGYLPLLLESIRQQSYKNYELIVADAQSHDQTHQIARHFNAKVVQGGLPGIGRNAGARVARGEYLLFLDADVILPPKFLEKAVREFDQRYLELAIPLQKPLTSLRIDHKVFEIQNMLMQIMQNFYPLTYGAAILVTRRLHSRIGGFNEALKMHEDNDYGFRARSLAKVGVLVSTHIKLSMRRFEKEGRTRMMAKYVQYGLSVPLKKLGFDVDHEYGFGGYETNQELTTFEQTLENMLAFLERK